MKASLIQMDIAWEDKVSNYRRAERFVKDAAEEGCDVAVLPEMFNTGFSMDVEATAEEEQGPTASVLEALSRKYRINIIAGFAVLNSKGKAGNVAHVYGRDGLLMATYYKMHPFSLSGEDRNFQPGGEPLVFSLEGMPASVFICYDLRFPEAMRAVASQVQAIFFIANWPAARASHWHALLRARAIENQCFVIGVNRTGEEPSGNSYAGGSMVVDPMGEVLCEATAQEQMLSCRFEPDYAEQVRSELPFLRDMKPLNL